MLNIEFYKEELKKIIETDGFDVGIVGNKPVSCHKEMCSKCSSDCSHVKLLEWMLEEHKMEKLKKRERTFCELVQTGFIARDYDGSLWFFKRKPKKEQKKWKGTSINVITNFDIGFSFITWEDAEPWSIEELLNLEVEENEIG